MAPFDTSFVYSLQNAIFQFEKVAIGLPVLVLAVSLARFLLWVLLTPALGRAAGLVSSLCMYLVVALLFMKPGLAMTAINYSYAVATRLIGGAGGLSALPGVGVVDQITSGINDAFSQLTSIFNF
jgi:hypothetical protein